ncbi:SpoIIE family protein phosphatase [Nocardioides sp. WL0053]|uniref:histidine kinase n=1 Tax=Nocardioides jiangsuensis TaxID=2866161 RepID=A0ABS7RK49_9ACTN|nr:SpoIIE family protein phosphatase [Nocardioides jiangsuensis]MBY9074859.1 SpoIIE family protein phosphatase [Nocardioides jiangsuensis]
MRAMLERSGEIGRDLLAVDWAATPLGPPDGWPRSLQTVVRMLITSRFSMWMAWGPELTFFCNEAYRRDTLGKKYPWALGKPASVVWSEVWHDAGSRIQHVLSTGEATWDKSLQLFLERSGYVEETYHTFSYSPLADDQGTVAGMLCVVTEDTQEVIGHRRMGALRDLGARTATKLGADEAVAQACRQLAASPEDLPFTLVYLLDGESGAAHLAGSTGFKGDHMAAPADLVPDSPDAVWPALPTLDGRTVVVDDLERRFADLPTGCWPEPPLSAVLLPLAQSSQAPPYGFLVAGINRYRPLDDGYRDFLELLAGQLAGTINDARAFDFERQRAETLAQLDRAKTDFFTNISHEFRTPLTLLLGPAEDALSDADQPLPDRQRGRVDVILRNGQRLLKLVNTLLDFSRLESGRLEAHFEPLDLAAYTRELAAMFDAAAERLGLTLTVDCPPLPEEVYVDRDLWAKIVLNLLSNALKFTFTGGISVRLHAEGHEAVLTVTDTGTGIPPGELPHLFERFHRVHGAASRTHEGSGIGLALVSELTGLHGGHVAAESRLGVGSTLTVRIPFGTAHLDAGSVARRSGDGTASALRDAQGFLEEVTHLADGARGESVPVPRATPRGDVPRILVVDDNADIRDYVVNLLAEDYRVDTAVDGADGLAKARDSVPDLVLTDVMMPRMDGFELLAALQEDPLTLGVPVVMLSARAGEEGMLQGLDAGADDYLIKPFTGRELLARVRANLELDRARRVRRQLERSRSLLDQAQRLAQVGSWEIDLRTGGLEVSDEFLRIAGRSREVLAEMVYPDVVLELVHPEDRQPVRDALDAGLAGADISYEARMLLPDGRSVLVAVHAEVVHDGEGHPELIRGSVQDITERRAAEEALSLAAANAEAAAREHAIADQLQRSLLPRLTVDLEHLEVATYYRAGVEGTQVGGDWYDVIELGAGRTALVVGDVMGRGVQAAAVMGQLRAAIRAYARLDLPPADVLEFLDGIVRELGENQIVTCLYAVFDPADRTLRMANAGHLPPILVGPDRVSQILWGAEDPPLGAGPFTLTQQDVKLDADSLAVLYTDGLVERRGEDLEHGVHALARLASEMEEPTAGMPERLVQALLPDGPDDDVAVLVARVDPPEGEHGLVQRFEATESSVLEARHLVARHLAERAVPRTLIDEAVLTTSELLTNAIVHGVGPIDVRLRTNDREVLIEVQDRATFQPRKLRPTSEDEHGRGLQIVAALAKRWGTRATEDGKSVWCLLAADTSQEPDAD